MCLDCRPLCTERGRRPQLLVLEDSTQELAEQASTSLLCVATYIARRKSKLIIKWTSELSETSVALMTMMMMPTVCFSVNSMNANTLQA